MTVGGKFENRVCRLRGPQVYKYPLASRAKWNNHVEYREIEINRLVAKVLGTGRLLENFVRALSARFQLTGLNGTPLSIDPRKGGGVHAFLVRLAAEAAPVPGITELTLLGVERDEGSHILHLPFSLLVGSYNPIRKVVWVSQGATP